jgi:hypothetical protein
VSLKIRVFLEKRLVSISCKVLLSEKRRFRRFISQNVSVTVRFLPFSSFEGLFDFCDHLHHHPWTGHSPRQ